MAHIGLLLLYSLFVSYAAHGRIFNDTGVGSIAFEEAWTVSELIHQSEYVETLTTCPT